MGKDRKKYMHAWYLKNREKVKARTKKWAADNPEAAKRNHYDCCKRWREEHREQSRTYMREYMRKYNAKRRIENAENEN